MQSSTIDFAVTVIGPVLALLVMGNILIRVKLINDDFVAMGSKLVFTVALPALLFLSISQADFSHAANPLLIGMQFQHLVLYALATAISSCAEN